MSLNYRSTFSLIAIILFFSFIINAQPQKGKFIDAAIGLGISAPYDNIDIGGSGFYAQGEYVFGLKKWFGFRPYAGFIITSPSESITNQNLTQYEVTSKAFLLGGKIRVAAPIPWVAPYIEIGLGASIGSFVTYTPETNKKKNGLLMHIPYTIGLALGRNNNVEVAFTYYDHPSVEQFSGAAAIGLSFPLN